MNNQRICLLSNQQHMTKYRVYKIRGCWKPAWVYSPYGHTESGPWRVAFMSSIVSCGYTFQQAVDRAHLNEQSWRQKALDRDFPLVAEDRHEKLPR